MIQAWPVLYPIPLAAVIGPGLDIGPKPGQSGSFLAICLSAEFIFLSRVGFDPRVAQSSLAETPSL